MLKGQERVLFGLAVLVILVFFSMTDIAVSEDSGTDGMSAMGEFATEGNSTLEDLGDGEYQSTDGSLMLTEEEGDGAFEDMATGDLYEEGAGGEYISMGGEDPRDMD
ncbi:MAG: hypothetical protein PHH49_00425 [Candidatus Omnitrophica bacterium]|nr:hypothetical protein [Candidatus Omnitrophota bacterium]MDD5487418.1 hypothetical protein [Candidatus Omnitrophota bacterium]